jgi:uncharacterized membrane protein YtjA (UPF0391 family)
LVSTKLSHILELAAIFFMTDNPKVNSNDRFVRWQAILREHVTFLNNLLITISIAVFGFLITLLKDVQFTPTGNSKILFTIGLVLILLSIILGLIASFFRLKDFRTTLTKIKSEIKNVGTADLGIIKIWMDLYGKVTWILLYTQFWVFLSGIFSLTLGLLTIYYKKLF